MSDNAPKNVVQMRDFPGLVVSVDPHDVEPGVAVIQVNVTSQNPGMLKTRMGWRVCVFEGE